jgi:hypothetical protein
MDWTGILACTTGTVDQELLLRNEYLAAENRILRCRAQKYGPEALAMPSRRDAPASMDLGSKGAGSS